MSTVDGNRSQPAGQQICGLSQWFYRRIGMLVALVAGLGLFFLYDGLIGYPKKNFKVDLYEAFEAGRTGASYPGESGSANEFDAEQLKELDKAQSAGRDGATWAGFAAERMMPEKVPERYTKGDIREQFVCAIVMGGLVIVIGVFLLRQRGRVFRYGPDALTTPAGETISFEKGYCSGQKSENRTCTMEIIVSGKRCEPTPSNA